MVDRRCRPHLVLGLVTPDQAGGRGTGRARPHPRSLGGANRDEALWSKADGLFESRAQLGDRLVASLLLLLHALHHHRIQLRSDRLIVMANRVLVEGKRGTG